MDTSHNPAIKSLLDDLLLGIPGVTVGKAFGFPAYKVSGKVFAFVGGEGMGLKLPVERVGELVARGALYSPFEPVAGTVWKAWVSIDHPDANAYRDHLTLFEESVAFVAE